MFNLFCLWTGRIFWGAVALALLGFAFACFVVWGRKKFPSPHLTTEEKVKVIENWLEKKSFHNFKELYFKMFLLPMVWWWRPGYRIWHIIRNTWINHLYEDCIIELKAHKK